MNTVLNDNVLAHFSNIEDPRLHNHNFRHLLHDILMITILATICGADTWPEIVRFAKAKQTWLKTFLALPHGIPSHDTFGRVFSLIRPENLGTCFQRWLATLSIDRQDEVIAIDGKRVRGSGNKRQDQPALHLVSAWATKARMMLAQVKTSDKSNEITAIPVLLRRLNIQGSVITIDAMGTQKAIAKQIHEQQADYVLALKDNQKTLHDDVQAIFERAEQNKQKQYKNILHLRKVEKRKGHGRTETRRYTLVSARDPLAFSVRWPWLKGIGKVDITRTTNNHVEKSTRYFLTSLDYTQIDRFMTAVCQHWNIEINLHWSLDVSFREDLSQVRIGYAAENLALMRRIALNLLKQEKTHKNGITCRRKTAGWIVGLSHGKRTNKGRLIALSGF